MKRILCVTCGILMLASSAVAEETCANGKGKLVQDHDGNNYCVSQVKMNWFSAFSWCETVGGKLPTLEDCNCKDCGVTPTSCPNLRNVMVKAEVYGFWLSNVASSEKVYVATDGRVQLGKREQAYTACKMP